MPQRKWKANVVCHILYGKTLFIGKNSDKTSPRYKKLLPDGAVSYSTHAECNAMDKLPHDVNPSRLKVYVYRYGARGELRMARPCKDCMYRLLSIGIKPKNIWFSNPDGDIERVG